MVSTDSEEIAEIAKAYGAKVPFMRSEKTSDDFATTSDVLLEVLERYKDLGRKFWHMCCIYPTAPFVTAEKLKEASQILEDSQAVQVMPVVSFSYPPQRSYILDEHGRIAFRDKQYLRARSQDLETWYHDAGQFYMYDAEKYLKLNGNVLENIIPVFVPELQVQDIDHEEDWKIAELKYQLMMEMQKLK